MKSIFLYIDTEQSGQKIPTSHITNKRKCPDVVFSDLEDVGEYLGITDSVRAYSDFDPFVKNYFEWNTDMDILGAEWINLRVDIVVDIVIDGNVVVDVISFLFSSRNISFW